MSTARRTPRRNPKYTVIEPTSADVHGSPDSAWWAEWFQTTARDRGPAFALRMLLAAAVPCDPDCSLRAVDWWPDLVSRRDVDACKARFRAAENVTWSPALIALVELASEAIAARVLPCAGDSDADAFANTLLRLTAALKTEIELALPSPSSSTH